jgi:hypothetical protein
LAAKNQTKKRQKQLAKARLDKQRRDAKVAKDEPFIDPPANREQDTPRIRVDRFLRAVIENDQRVWDVIIEYLCYFETHQYLQFGRSSLMRLNEFVQCMYTVMLKEELVPTPEQGARLTQINHILNSVVAASCFRNNDAALDCVLPMQNNVAKITALMNPRCEIQLNQEKLFDLSPQLASLWYMAYILGLSSPTERIQRNLYRHFQLMDERWVPVSHVISGLYFSCTYHNPDHVLHVKGIINSALKAARPAPPVINTPDPKSIAIVTNRWHRNHAVYKSASPLVEQLVGKYKLTLVWTGEKKSMPPTSVTDYFDKVVHCYFQPNGELIMPQEVVENDFQMVYYPDIGMSDESIWMSNMRLAPIQAVGYGHPDTTGPNNEIDYFIGGDIEKESTDKYAETMVLLPGLAQEPAIPTAPRQNNYKDDGIVRINCVWGPDKYNFSLLTLLRLMNEGVAKIDPNSTHEIHLFGSPGMNRYGALPAFSNEIRRMLPNAILHTQQEYYDYMENAEMHDFSLNSYPFGCYNVLIESLYMGLPFLSLVGTRFYNKAGMWLNERVGMAENNFTDPGKFVAKAVELITNPNMLRRQREHLASVDLKEAIFTLKGEHFLEAVEHIIAHHPFTETKIIGDDK